MLKLFFSKTHNKIIALAVCLALVVTTLAVLMSGTWAAGGDVSVTFDSPYDPDIVVPIDINAVYSRAINGASGFAGNNPALATISKTTNPTSGINTLIITPTKAGLGALSVASSTKSGYGVPLSFAIVDNAKMTGYVLQNGGEIQISKVGQTASAGGAIKSTTPANLQNSIAWSVAYGSDIVTVTSSGTVTATKDGAAIIFGKLTDKWGAEQTIPVLVQVGTPVYVIQSDDGSYWLPGDKPGIYYETDENGKIKVPPHIIWNPNGPGKSPGDKDLYLGDDGKYYVADDQYPNIWHEFDVDNGQVKPGGGTIWGGPNGRPGGGDDKPAVKNGGDYYVDWGQNVFQKVNKNGPNAGQVTGNPLLGGGVDTTPGTSDDLTPVFLHNDGKYYAGPFYEQDNTPYYIGDKRTGGNGKLMTSGNGSGGHQPIHNTDQKYYMDSNGNMVTEKPVVLPSVSSVTISPNTVDVTKGKTQQFTATVTGNNNPVQTVFWSISGNNSPNTSIDPGTGLLTVAFGETSSTLTVTGTSILDPTKSGTATITVKTPPITEEPTGADDRTLTDAQTGDGEWIEIARNGEYSLIVRKKYINYYGSNYDDPAFIYLNYGATNVYKDSNVRKYINDWFNGTVKSGADKLASGARLRDFTMQNNAKDVLGTGNSGIGGLTNGFSKPTNIMIPSGSDDVAFALSFCEVANFCSKEYETQGGGGQASSNNLAKNNFNKLNIYSVYCYGMWLRNKGDNPTYQTAGALDYTGRAYQFHISSSTASEKGTIYPALWVKSAIFD